MVRRKSTYLDANIHSDGSAVSQDAPARPMVTNASRGATASAHAVLTTTLRDVQLEPSAANHATLARNLVIVVIMEDGAHTENTEVAYQDVAPEKYAADHVMFALPMDTNADQPSTAGSME